MDYNSILLRYGEIFLKGKNKPMFERKLISNIEHIAKIKVKKLRSRLITDYFANHLMLKKVFGLVSYSPALKFETDVEEIKKQAAELLKDKKGYFKVKTKRSDKRFPIKSPDLDVLIGQHIEKNSSLKFNFHSELILNIEINQEGTFLFLETIYCFGGLPTGVEGKVNVLIEDSASFLAGILFMKRGTGILPMAYSDKDISLLQKYSPIPLELEIVKDLNKYSDGCLVVGDNFDSLKEYDTELLIFRPLIAYSEEEIEKQLEQFRN
jgi:tRNA uracil 4-sulfurtransferase